MRSVQRKFKIVDDLSTLPSRHIAGYKGRDMSERRVWPLLFLNKWLTVGCYRGGPDPVGRVVVHLGSRSLEEALRIVTYIMIISQIISKNYNVSLPEVAEMLAECCYRCLGLNIVIMTWVCCHNGWDEQWTWFEGWCWCRDLSLL